MMNARHITCENQGIVFGYAMAMSNVARLVAIHMPECGYAQSFAYAYDALSRPISRNADTFGYNVRGEVVSATVGGNGEAHSYDHIGNAVLAASGGVTNAYAANSLNQYTQVGRAAPCPPSPDGGLGQAAPPVTPAYDADGNLTAFGPWAYAYDAANRLVSVSSNGVPLVTNFYDAQSRRVRKVTPEATTTCFYDGWNLVEERIAHTNGTTSTIHYYWGKDLSGSFQDAGGIGGLIYLTVDGVPYVPFYDSNGNVTHYCNANGAVVAAYTYGAFGKTVAQSGPLSDIFRHRFSTKYFDGETGLYYYGYRFYVPSLMRWLNRDPIGEDGGANLYSLINNNPISGSDYLGLAIIVIKHLPGTTPPSGWPDTDDAKCLALTVYKGPTYSVSETKYPGGKIGFKVDVNPPNTFVDVYFRTSNDFLTKMQYEKDHISVARRHEQAVQDFKRRVEAICDCPKPAREAKDKEELSLIRKVQALRAENAAYDAQGGPHVLRR